MQISVLDADAAIDVPHPVKARGDLDCRLSLVVIQYGARENNRIINESDLDIGCVHVPGFRQRIRDTFFKARSGARIFWVECFTMKGWGLEDHDLTSLLFPSNAQRGFLFICGPGGKSWATVVERKGATA